MRSLLCSVPYSQHLSTKTPVHLGLIRVHVYIHSHLVHPVSTSTEPPPKPRRHLPTWLSSSAGQPHASHELHKATPDNIFKYGSAVLNNGLLKLEMWDAIHEGDGPRIIRCWKFLLLYFRFAGHLNPQMLLNGTASPRIASQLLCDVLLIHVEARDTTCLPTYSWCTSIDLWRTTLQELVLMLKSRVLCRTQWRIQGGSYGSHEPPTEYLN